jgi:hypothetical protein
MTQSLSDTARTDLPSPNRTFRNERPTCHTVHIKRRGRYARTPLRPGTAALLVRARPRAQKRDSALCLRPKKRPATIGRPIAPCNQPTWPPRLNASAAGDGRARAPVKVQTQQGASPCQAKVTGL